MKLLPDLTVIYLLCGCFESKLFHWIILFGYAGAWKFYLYSSRQGVGAINLASSFCLNHRSSSQADSSGFSDICHEIFSSPGR